jgi:hypothetical protein
MTYINRIAIVVFLLALLAPLALTAPSSAAAQAQQVFFFVDSVDVAAFSQVSVRLSAWDEAGLPLADLGPQNFTLQEDGGSGFNPTTVQLDRQAPLTVALVIDVSSSMAGQPLQDAQAAAARFLDRLQPGVDQAALLAFSSPVDPDPAVLDPMRELRFTSDLTQVYNLAENLQAGGQTHLYLAAAKALRLFEGTPPGHRAVLLLTDGRNEPEGEGDPELALRLARDSRVPFFVIGLGQTIDLPYLQRLAFETGGLFRPAPSSAELGGLFAELAELLKTQYTLVYPSTLPPDGAEHTLALTLQVDGAQAQASLPFGPLPLIPTQPAPSETPLPEPSPTPAPSETPLPTATPTPLPSATALPFPLPTQAPPPPPAADNSLLWWGLGGIGLLLAAGLVWLFIRRRGGAQPAPEACAKCGYDLSGVTGACPQCGSTRRLPRG